MTTREEQDKLWDELSQESRDRIKKEYGLAILNSVENITAKTYEDLFGKHNLQVLITYKDVASYLFGCDNEKQYGSFCCPVFSEGHCDKLSAINALLCVAKFLNKNEDGSDWVPDFSDENQPKWHLYIDYIRNEKGRIMTSWRKRFFRSEIVYFRTEELAELAIQILGEDCILTALTTKY